MGNVVNIESFKRAQAQECPWSEEDLIGGWSEFVRQSWRPVRDVKRGAVKAVMRVAYRDSDGGREWLKVCPIDLVQAALPKAWHAGNVKAASFLTMLLFDYLWRIGAISEADKDFAFDWTRRAELTMRDLLDRFGTVED